jgi:hypothetical protein
MKNIALALVPAAALLVSPLAIGGKLNSDNSQFLFGKDKVAAKTLSEKEMQATKGQHHGRGGHAPSCVGVCSPLITVGS